MNAMINATFSHESDLSSSKTDRPKETSLDPTANPCHPIPCSYYEGLPELYTKTAASIRPLGFNPGKHSISFTRISPSSTQESVTVCQEEARDAKEILESVNRFPRGTGLSTCVVTVPTSSDNQYLLDIKEEDYRSLVDNFGLEQCIGFASSASTSFDLTPRRCSQNARDFTASFHLQDAWGLYLAYDEAQERILGLCWGIRNVLPRFVQALSILRMAALQPSYTLVAMVAALNCYHSWRSASLSQSIAQVERRTGHQGWDISMHTEASGSYSDLSARISGILTSLASNHRVLDMCDQVLSAVKRTVPECDVQAIQRLPRTSEDHLSFNIATLSRRLTATRVTMGFLVSRAGYQLTAVS